MKYIDMVTISYWLTDWCREAYIDPRYVQYFLNKERLEICICTNYPGRLIGKHGLLFEEYQHKLRKKEDQYKCEEHCSIKLIESTPANYWVDYCWME